jgi:thymidine phosphorylase
VRDTGIAVVSQSARLTPAGRRLEALRDATATTPATGLVAASVMSRAIAGGAGAVSLEVTHGPGAYLADAPEAEDAAALMAALARPWGRRVGWTLAALEAPQGRAIGNALEVREAAEVLRGGGPDDVRDLAVALAGDLAEAAGVVPEGEGADQAAAALRDGRALAAAERWVEAQGGDPAVWTEPVALPAAPLQVEVQAPRAGIVAAVGARAVGEAARWLGAGRLHPMQSLDPVAGIEVLVRVGDAVEEGQPIAVVHAREDGAAARARDMAEAAFAIGDETVPARPVVLQEGRGGA